MLKKTVQRGCSELKRLGVRFGKSASERRENAAGGLFQHHARLAQ